MSTILNSIYCTVKKILAVVLNLQDNSIILKDTFNNPL